MRTLRRRDGRSGGLDGGIDGDDGFDRRHVRRGSLMTRGVNAVFGFVRLAEFEILFFLFFFIAFLIFKDLTSRPEYNDLFVKKPGGDEFWPYY